MAGAFFAEIRRQAETKNLLSCKHYSPDGTLVEAAASQKSFVHKDQEEDRNRPTGRIPIRRRKPGQKPLPQLPERKTHK